MMSGAASKLGRYEIQQEIGRGAMGVVYRAVDPVLGRPVAIKTIGMSHDAAERAEYEARFYQEAKAAGGLAHPNIVTVHDIGDSGNTAYMAMELLDGEELGRRYGDGRSAPLDQAVDIAAQIASGLAYAHGRGVVHRDVKPANIMVLADGRVKITDFGIARMRSAEVKTQTGMMLGSPRYMPPEIFLGKRADHRSDIFSLGIILYEMITGAPPFKGESVNALMYQTINFVPPAPSALRAEAPKMLDFIVAKTLAKEPAERYQSAGELESDLRALLLQLRSGTVLDAMPASPRASIAPGAQAQLADTAVRDDLMEQTFPLTRAGDSLADGTPPASTLGISRSFDSMAATQRVAERTGMAQEFDDVATTMKLPTPAAGHAAPAAPAAAPRRPAPPPAEGAWSRREVLIFAVGMAVAIGIAIALAMA
jgi:serine/threonine protein kinase